MDTATLPARTVQAQYEDYPYPPRNPADEDSRLMM